VRSLLSGSALQLIQRYDLKEIMTLDDKGDNGEPENKEACRKGCRRFTIQKKAAIIRTMERLMQQHGMTRREAREDLNISSGMHWAWKQKMDAMLEAKKNNIKANAFIVENFIV
jgi:hypothetical protein